MVIVWVGRGKEEELVPRQLELIPVQVLMAHVKMTRTSVVAYDDVGECLAADTTTYRIFTSESVVYGGFNGWGLPPSGITCAVYRDGGATGLFDCNGDFTDNPTSIDSHPNTQIGGVTSIGSLTTCSQGPAKCSSEQNQGYFSGKQVNECFTQEAQNDFRSWNVILYGTID